MTNETLEESSYVAFTQKGKSRIKKCMQTADGNKRWNRQALQAQKVLDKGIASVFGSFEKCQESVELWQKDPNYAINMFPVPRTKDMWITIRVSNR